MGIMNCLNLSLDNIIAIIDIGITFYIGYIIQKNTNNKRALKDILIIEIKEIRQQYSDFYTSLLRGDKDAKEIVHWLKSMTIKINSLKPILLDEYSISKNLFNPYILKLREIITESEDFISGYKEEKIIFKDEVKKDIFKFQQKNDRIFIKLIQEINNK